MPWHRTFLFHGWGHGENKSRPRVCGAAYGEDPDGRCSPCTMATASTAREVSQFAMEYIRDNLHKHPSFTTDLPAALKTTFLAATWP